MNTPEPLASEEELEIPEVTTPGKNKSHINKGEAAKHGSKVLGFNSELRLDQSIHSLKDV